MRILTVADEPSSYLWGPGVGEALAGVDLILSCGDLPPDYLEYLVTLSGVPLLYVHGNHDGRRGEREPEGCTCVDGRLVRVKGLRILGLGGSVRYNREGGHQYTQGQMARRAARLALPLRRHRGMDILLAHSAALGLGDGTDPAHVGFAALRDLVDRWQPACFIHGHCHMSYNFRQQRETLRGDTRIINAYEKYILDIPEEKEDTP